MTSVGSVSPTTNFYVYNGPGADKECVSATRGAIEREVDPNLVCTKEISLDEIANFPEINPRKTCIVLPGGSVADYQPNIMSNKNKAWHAFIQTEKTLGFCAGAGVLTNYSLNININNSKIRLDPYNSDLPFRSIQPLTPLTESPRDFLKYYEARRIQGCVDTIANKTFTSFYCLGPWFPNTPSLPLPTDCEIIARYTDVDIQRPCYHSKTGINTQYCESNPAAVVEWKSSTKAQAILSGCHPELSSDAFLKDLEAKHMYALTQSLGSPESIEGNRALLRLMLQRLGAPLRELASASVS